MTVLQFAPANPGTRRLHEPFLERASEGDERGHALGAFLTLRVVDRITEDPTALRSEALLYQLKAAGTYLEEVYPQTEDVKHLREIVRIARNVNETGNKRLLWSPMLAFAYWLEQELRLDESLDVLDSTLQLESASAIQEKVATQLHRGRVLRLLGQFQHSHMAYAAAGELANLSGDRRSEMVSRIGRATNMQKTGDLPQSEQILRGVLSVSRKLKDTFVESRALHGLAVTLWLTQRLPEAVALAYGAFELYDEPVQRARALSDVGMLLKDLGHYSAAQEAFMVVLGTEPSPEIRLNTVLELLELTFHVQDRVGFKRWRREIEQGYEMLPAAERVDFEMKVGAGLAAFGSNAEAEVRVERALKLAQKYKLGQVVFEADRLLKELRAGKASRVASPAPAEREVAPEMRRAIESLYALRAG